MLRPQNMSATSEFVHALEVTINNIFSSCSHQTVTWPNGGPPCTCMKALACPSWCQQHDSCGDQNRTEPVQKLGGKQAMRMPLCSKKQLHMSCE